MTGDIFDDIDRDELRRKAARATAELRDMRSRWERERQRADAAEGALAAMMQMEQAAPPIPKRSKVASGKRPPRTSTAILACSDWHVESVISKREMRGLNEHNPEIARARNDRLVEAWTWYIRDAFGKGQVVDEALIWLGGDMIENSDMPHNDVAEGCAMPPGEAILFAMELWEKVIARTLDLGLPVRVVCNDGNHGRMTEKIKNKNRTGHSIETLGYRMSAGRMTQAHWTIADSMDLITDVKGKRLRTSHGDKLGLNYKSGVGGLAIPYGNKHSKWATLGESDVDLMGHWHTYQLMINRGIVNGSTVGYAPFAYGHGIPREPPCQAAFLIDSEHGLRFAVPLYVGEP